MADLVVARVGNVEKLVGRAFAEKHNLELVDEPSTRADGSLRPTTRAKGRPVKPKTTVDQSATAKKDKAADAPASTAEEATE